MRYLSLAGHHSVSVLGLGGGPFGSQIDDAAAHRLLDAFLDAGGNLIDTAHIYGAWAPQGSNGGEGNSEVTIGRWLKTRGCRDRVILTTKGGHPDFATGETRLTRSGVQRHLHESLTRLQTDTIDVYYLHRDDRSLPVTEILGWLQDAVDAGRIREVACSNWRVDRFLEARQAGLDHGLPIPVTNQIGWSLAHPNHSLTHDQYGEQVAMDDTTWGTHARLDLPLTAYQAQAGGLFALLDKFEGNATESPDFPKPQLLRRYGNATTLNRHQRAQALARQHGCSTNQLALAWLLHQPFPTFALIGPRTPYQLMDSLRVTEIKLSPAEVSALHQPLPSSINSA